VKILSGMTGRNRLNSLCAVAILVASLGCTLAPVARAQDMTQLPTKNVTVTLSNSPVRVALDALFKSVGLNYTIDPSITQSVTVNLKDVPFDVALHAILRSTNPPLQYTTDNGIYRITQEGTDTSNAAGPTPIVGPNTAPDQTDATSDDNTSDQGAAGESDQNQTVVIYLKYIGGQLLNAVVGPVVDLPPTLYTPGASGTGGAGGATAGGGGMTGGMGGMTGGMGGMTGGMSGGMGMGSGMSGGFGGGNVTF